MERRQGDWIQRFAVSMLLGYLVLYLLGPHWLSGYRLEYPDTASYHAVARRAPWSPRFWFDERPPTYPLLIWTLRHSQLAVVVVQTLLSLAAWIWLVRELLAATARRYLSYPAVAVLFVVAIEARWIFWDTLVLTESLSATLAVAMIAGWLWWWSCPTRTRAVVLAALIVAWMLLRDSNAMTWLAVAAPALVVAVVMARRVASPRRTGAVVILGISVLAGAYSMIAQIATDRGETSFHNNVGLRWLPNPDMTEFMVERGMPLDQALLDRTGRTAWEDGEAFLRSPDLAAYREWANGRGRTAAAESFVLKAPWYLEQFARQANVYADPTYLFPYDYYGVAARFPHDGLGPIDPVRSFRSLVVWGILGTGALALAVVFRRGFGLMLMLLWVSVAVDSYLSFSADAIEVGRHLAGPWFRFSVLSIVAIVLGTDTWLTARAERDTSQPDLGESETAESDVAGRDETIETAAT